jgi:hypothetical protein
VANTGSSQSRASSAIFAATHAAKSIELNTFRALDITCAQTEFVLIHFLDTYVLNEQSLSKLGLSIA